MSAKVLTCNVRAFLIFVEEDGVSINCTRLPCRRTFISLLLNWPGVSVFVLVLSKSNVFMVLVFTGMMYDT